MDKISDNELFMMATEENEDAKTELYNRYQHLINIVIKKYSKAALKLGIEYNDFQSEALYGFSDALNSFNQNKNASLATFISLCVERRLQKALVRASTLKNQVNIQSYSLDYLYEETEKTLNDVIIDNKNEPLQRIMSREDYKELITLIKDSLSDAEYTVFTFLANGFDYQEIAQILGKSPKQIDNTMSRIKNKLKLIIKVRQENM